MSALGATIRLLLILAVLSAPVRSQELSKQPTTISFERFPTKVYQGPVKIPKGLHQDPDGAWLDELDKWVSEPTVNFAGEYYLAAHSCGTCCRYYSLSSLRTGRAFTSASMFDAGDTPPRTKDGHTYVPILFFRPNSRLLIVQYDLDPCTRAESNKCRQRYFVFEGGRFKAISTTYMSCTREGEEPE
jgi:hypothetical protein